MAYVTARHDRPQSIASGLRGLLANWREDLERHREFSRVHGELSAMSDRELDDIGISRAQIVDVAWGAVRRR